MGEDKPDVTQDSASACIVRHVWLPSPTGVILWGECSSTPGFRSIIIIIINGLLGTPSNTSVCRTQPVATIAYHRYRFAILAPSGLSRHQPAPGTTIQKRLQQSRREDLGYSVPKPLTRLHTETALMETAYGAEENTPHIHTCKPCDGRKEKYARCSTVRYGEGGDATGRTFRSGGGGGGGYRDEQTTSGKKKINACSNSRIDSRVSRKYRETSTKLALMGVDRCGGMQ